MGDSVFRKIQKILEKPQPPAHMRERNFQVEIPWHQRVWSAVRPPAAVGSDRKPINRSQRRMLWVTTAVLIPAGLGWWVYDYIENAPLRAKAAYDEGMRLQAKGSFSAAVVKFSDALDIAELPRTHLQRGLAYQELESVDKALEDWTRAIEMDASLTEAFTARGTHYRRVGNTAKALQDLDESIRIEPSLDAYFQRGQVYAALGQFDKAVEDYDLAIGQRREAPYVYLARAIARRALGDEAGFEEDQATALRLQQ